ncbi:hypothetical protein KBI33_01705 [Candidatus Shapirobacteria bacterium]|nr:hypothetical protein [Candidatus Shapirobacteria bacterium]
MKLLENYKTAKGEIFAILVNENLEPYAGDYEGLRFKVVPSLNKGDSWNCIVKISGTLQAIWGVFDVYNLLEELGGLKIKEAVEKREPFLEFMFSTYTAGKTYKEEKDKLLEKLKKLQKREPLTEESKKENPAEIFARNKELRWKVLKIHYELSQGNSCDLVMRQDVAKKLEIDPNSHVLLGIYKFLEDERFLKRHSNVGDFITSEGIKEVERGYSTLLSLPQTPSFQEPKLNISIDEIESLGEVKNVSVDEIRVLVPLKYSEEQIQNWFEEIIEEPEHKKDWGGEINDLFTSRLLINGTRKIAAFLLKGAGKRMKELKISDCGKNGDQIQRLFKSPADIFIIQFVGPIAEAVVEEAKSKTLLLRHEGKDAQFCIIDGYDTARILRAYKKI